MEEKLAAYRARRAKEKEAENSLINRIKKYVSNSEKNPTTPADALKKTSQSGYGDEHHQGDNDDLASENTTNQSTSLYWTLTGLKFLLWLCIWAIFIELEFGAVFFTVSLLFFLYFNTRSGKKDKNNMSAYSVFNKNCESIQGTVTAEQMQRNMFRVPGLPS